MAIPPYETLPAHCFWPDDVESLDPVVRPKFKIGPRDKVATVRGDFSEHNSRRLESAGFHHLITEDAPPLLKQSEAARLGYGVATARIGEVSTTGQFLDRLPRAYGRLSP